jgi:hypothetical protein
MSSSTLRFMRLVLLLLLSIHNGNKYVSLMDIDEWYKESQER